MDCLWSITVGKTNNKHVSVSSNILPALPDSDCWLYKSINPYMRYQVGQLKINPCSKYWLPPPEIASCYRQEATLASGCPCAKRFVMSYYVTQEFWDSLATLHVTVITHHYLSQNEDLVSHLVVILRQFPTPGYTPAKQFYFLFWLSLATKVTRDNDFVASKYKKHYISICLIGIAPKTAHTYISCSSTLDNQIFYNYITRLSLVAWL